MENNYIFCTLAGDKRYVNDPKYKVINKKDFIKCIDKHFNGGINWINQRNFYINVNEDLVKNVNCLLFFKGEQPFENYSYPYIINECKIAFIIKKSTPNKKIIRVDCEIDNFYDIDVFRDLSGLIKQTTLPLYTYYHTTDNNYIINQNILNKQNFDLDLEKIEKIKNISAYSEDYQGFFYKTNGDIKISENHKYLTQAIRKPLNIDKNFKNQILDNNLLLSYLNTFYGFIDKNTFDNLDLEYSGNIDKLNEKFNANLYNLWVKIKTLQNENKDWKVFIYYYKEGYFYYTTNNLINENNFNKMTKIQISENKDNYYNLLISKLKEKGLINYREDKDYIVNINGDSFFSRNFKNGFWYYVKKPLFEYQLKNEKNLDLILLVNPQFRKYFIYSKNVIHQLDFSYHFIRKQNFNSVFKFNYIQIEAPESGISYFKDFYNEVADVVNYVRNDLIVNNNFDKYFYENQSSINFQKEMIDFNIMKQSIALPFSVLGSALNTQANVNRFMGGNQFINAFDIGGLALNTIGNLTGGILGIIETQKQFEKIEANNKDKKRISTISSLSNGLRDYLIYDSNDIDLVSISVNDNLINVLDFYFKKYGYVMSNYEKTIDLSYHHKVDYLEIIDLNYINKCSKEVNDYLNALFSKGIFLIFEDKENKDNLDNYMFLDKTILLGKENNPY